MRAFMLLLLLPILAGADYVDPYGLPSGSASLVLASQADIAGGANVEAFDFAEAQVLDAPYQDHVSGGLADLVFFELHPDSADHYLRAPEGDDGFDRLLLAHLGPLELTEVHHMEDAELQVTVPAVDGDAYVMFQIQAEAQPETTAVKFRLTYLSEVRADFDWAWQPNGSLHFVPSASEAMDFGNLKTLW